MSERYGEPDDVAVGRPSEDELVDLLGDSGPRSGLTGWTSSVGFDVSAAWRRRLGSGVVLAIGVVIAAVPLSHLLLHGGGVESLLGDSLPLLFGAILTGTAVWLYAEAAPVTPPVTAFWVASGFAVTGGVSAYFLSLHTGHGHVVESPLFLAYQLAATGGVGGLLVSRYDVRARRRNRRLSRRERQFRAVFEGTLDALVITDDAGRYVAANPAAADLFGIPRSELVGMHVDDFLVEDDPFVGDRRRGEIELRRPDGETRTVAFAATANVLPGHHLSALHDVTDRAEREAEVECERARVQFLNRLLRHNILNGMNLVMAKLDSLESSVPDDHRDEFDVIRHRSEEVVNLVQTARRLATDVEVDRCIDVCDPLENAVEAVREAYPESTVEFTPPEEEVRVRADDMLETVFDNLLTNAFEHNDAAAVTVTVGVEVDGETVRVTVADDGDGIPPGRRAQLFEEAEYEHARDWGGFGLSIVDVLVREYDGRVWVDANEPSGVVFNVELQRAG